MTWPVGTGPALVAPEVVHEVLFRVNLIGGNPELRGNDSPYPKGHVAIYARATMANELIVVDRRPFSVERLRHNSWRYESTCEAKQEECTNDH